MLPLATCREVDTRGAEHRVIKVGIGQVQRECILPVNLRITHRRSDGQRGS